jgi:hypothetical protein
MTSTIKIDLTRCEHPGFPAINEEALYEELLTLTSSPEAKSFLLQLHWNAHNSFLVALREYSDKPSVLHQTSRETMREIVNEEFYRGNLSEDLLELCNCSEDSNGEQYFETDSQQRESLDRVIDVYPWPEHISAFEELFRTMDERDDPRVATVVRALNRVLDHLESEDKREREIKKVEDYLERLRAGKSCPDYYKNYP